jgi:hypothetical protein
MGIHDDDRESGMRTKAAKKAMQDDEQELQWFFEGAAAALGFSAQAYGCSGGGGVFDEAARRRAHDQRTEPRHRATVDREARIAAQLARTPVEARVILTAAYSPHGWDEALRREMACGKRQGTLAGVALMTAAVRRAYAVWAKGRKIVSPAPPPKRERGTLPPPRPWPPPPAPVDPVDPPVASLHDWLVFESHKANARRALAPIRDETLARLAAALRAYQDAAHAVAPGDEECA